RRVVFADETDGPSPAKGRARVPEGNRACGFYWTEGIRGLGWAEDAVPTIKGGSGLGIPSPPPILMGDGQLGLPDLRGGERLQGLPADWTLPAQLAGFRKGLRWKLVGNAVSVPVSRWVGERLANPGSHDGSTDDVIQHGDRWPDAAWGADRKAYRVESSRWPV